MKIILLLLDTIIALIGGTGQIYNYLKQNTDYYTITHAKSVLLDTAVDLSFTAATLPICIICIGISLICVVYGIFKYFDTMFNRSIYNKFAKCLGWIFFVAVSCFNVWGMICMILYQA